MSQSPQIRITFYKQLPLSVGESTKPARGDYLLNILIFSLNKKLKFLDSALQQINEKDELFIVKCHNMAGLAYSIQTCKPGIKTILLVDQQIEKQAFNNILSNQQLLKNKDKFVCWLYTDSIEKIDPKCFYTQQIEVIVSSQQKLLSQIEQEVNKMRIKLTSYRSSSTIMSSDQIALEAKLQIVDSPSKKLISQIKNEESDDNFDDGVPGVGTYHLKNQSNWTASKSQNFSKSKSK